MWIERNGIKKEFVPPEDGIAFEQTSLPAKGWVVTTPPVPQQLTPEQVIARLTGVVQAHLDSKAKERNYDGILSACTYATSTVEKFRLEGQACVEWRDAVWSRCYQIMAECQLGTRAIPTAQELVALLPALVWPS